MIILKVSIVGKITSLCFVLIVIVALSGCSSSPKTFKEYYESYQKEIGNDVVKVEVLGETEIDEYVFALTANYNSDDIWSSTLSIHEVIDNGWEQVNATDCEASKVRLGYGENYNSYCGKSAEGSPINQVVIGEQAVEIIEYEGSQLWYYAEKSDQDEYDNIEIQ